MDRIDVKASKIMPPAFSSPLARCKASPRVARLPALPAGLALPRDVGRAHLRGLEGHGALQVPVRGGPNII